MPIPLPRDSSRLLHTGGTGQFLSPAMATTTSISMLDTFIVVLVGFIGATLAEGCAWYFVYRTENYQSLLEDVNRATRKLDKQKEMLAKSIKTGQKIKAQEQQIQKKNHNLSFKRMKAQVFSSVLYFLIIPLFNRFAPVLS